MASGVTRAPLEAVTVAEAEAETPSRAEISRRAYRLWCAGVVVVAAVVAALRVVPAGYYDDDFLNIGLDGRLGLTPAMLTRSIFGHFVPLVNLFDWGLSHLHPLPRWPVDVVEIASFALAVAFLVSLLTQLTGRRAGVVAIGLATGLSVLFVPSLAWWAAAQHEVTSLATAMACVDGYVRWRRTGRHRWLVWSGVAYAAGLGVYDAMLLFFPVLVLFALLFESASLHPRALWRAFWRPWPAWLVYLVPSAADLGWRLSHAATYASAPAPRTSLYVPFVERSLLGTFLPGLFGLNVWGFSSARSRDLASLAADLAVGLVVVVTLVRRPAVWRAWLLFLVPFVVTAVVVAYTRAAPFGLGAATSFRYLTFDVLLFGWALALAALPLRPGAPFGPRPRAATPDGSRPRARAATRRRSRTGAAGLRRAGAVAVVASLAVYGVVSWRSGSAVPLLRETHAAGAAARRFRSAWAQLLARHPGAVLWDSSAAPLSDVFYPYDLVQNTYGRVVGEVRSSASAGDFVVLPDGDIAPGSFRALVALPLGAPSTVVTGPGVLQRRVGTECCLFGGGNVAIRLGHSLPSGVWFVRVTGTASVPPVVLDGFGSLSLGADPSSSIGRLPKGVLSAIGLTLPPGGRVCLSAVEVGRPAATGPAVGS